jgi:hypothetical protein
MNYIEVHSARRLKYCALIIECPHRARLVVRFLSELLFGRRITVPKRKTRQIPEKKAMIAHLKSMGRCGERVIERSATCDTFTTNPLDSGTV